MARKKVCLFIVEGASDETALGVLIEKLVQNEAVVFDVFRTDIFSATQQRAGADPIMHIEKIHDRIRAVTLKHLERADYSWKDLDRIVLLADTDGCFIPDDAVVEREGIDSICYLNDHIETASAGGTRFRNKEKSSRLWGVIKGRRYVTKRNVRIPVSVSPFLRRYETQVMIGQWAMIAFSYSRSRSWNEIYSDALWFCRFVELGRGFAASIVGARCMRTGSVLDAGLEEAPFHYGSLVSIGVGVKPCTSRLTPSHMCPFKLSDALECGALESWFEKRELLEPIVGLLSVAYSSVVSTPSALFLNLMQALETLHSRFYAARLREYLSRVELLCESCGDSSLRNYLCDSGQLRARKVYLRSRMNDLFWADGVRPVEPDFCGFSECGDKLTKTRNYYTHYDQRLLSQCLPEDVLPAANVDLMALLTYHLMVILGFEKQFSREAVHRRFGV